LGYYLRELAMLWKLLLFPADIEIAKRHGSGGNSNTQLSVSLRTSRVMIVMTLVIGTLTVGLPLSPMLIQIAEATTEVPTCAGGSATIVGTNNDDVLQGTEGRDVIVGLGGNDQIFGKGGNDFLCGEGDNAPGSPGNDRLNGGDGDDELYGDDQGGNGNDRLDGGPENDFGDGGPNFDTCVNVETETNCEA
jgi:Ca2+-binding RTX toxin-like protein